MSATLTANGGLVYGSRDYSVGGDGPLPTSLPTIGSQECIAALGRLANQRISGQVTRTEWRARHRAILERTVPGPVRSAYEYALATILNQPEVETKSDPLMLALSGA